MNEIQFIFLQFKCKTCLYDSFTDKIFIKQTVDIDIPLHHFSINHSNCISKKITINVQHCALLTLFFALLICLSPQLRLVIRGASVPSTESVRTSLETGHVTESAWSPSVSETASTA